ncbi:hypothetical protein N7527_012008 [Penicillium freii]|nr:hypothetical protein N7527_012008 [Penicillium freii]
MPTLPPAHLAGAMPPPQCGPLSTGQFPPPPHQHAPGPLAGAMPPRDGAPVGPPHPGPRASRSRLAPRARASRSRRPASIVHRPVRRSGQLPRRANWRPMPPALGARSTAGRPLARGP